VARTETRDGASRTKDAAMVGWAGGAATGVPAHGVSGARRHSVVCRIRIVVRPDTHCQVAFVHHTPTLNVLYVCTERSEPHRLFNLTTSPDRISRYPRRRTARASLPTFRGFPASGTDRSVAPFVTRGRLAPSRMPMSLR
jgi:hypothetical protein